MPFGSTTQQKKQTVSKTFDPVFLDLKQGSRVIRIVSDEVQYKVFWTEVPVADSNGNIKEDKRPFIIARFNPESQTFEGHENEDWWQSPFNQFVQSLDEEARKKYYAKTRFVVNVWDRTPVKRTDGMFVYVDEDTAGAEPNNMLLVLEQSAGAIEENDKDDKSKHFLKTLITAAKQMRHMQTGKKIDIMEGDLRIVTTGSGTGTTRSVYPGYNQESQVVKELYDLWNYCTPWPYAAQQEILDGAEYNATREKYKLPKYPEKKPLEIPF